MSLAEEFPDVLQAAMVLDTEKYQNRGVLAEELTLQAVQLRSVLKII